jgi:hypothetical protein
MRALGGAGMLVVAGLGLMLAAAVGTGCGGGGSWLGDDLRQKLQGVDESFARGDSAAGCAQLGAAMPALYDWTEHTRGNLAVRAQQLLQRAEGVQAMCGVVPAPAGTPGAGVPSPAVAEQWRAFYDELRETTKHKTSWLTVFTWVSMFVLGIVVYVVLRRLKS